MAGEGEGEGWRQGMKRTRRDIHKAEKHAKEREGQEQTGIKSQPREGKRKPEMKKCGLAL